MRFSKWHGLGNDYLLVQRADLDAPLQPEQVRRLCDYHFGVGSDGVLEIVSANGDRAELVIWNPDGSTAELSGNGTRIAARWLARRSGADTVRLEVGPREAQRPPGRDGHGLGGSGRYRETRGRGRADRVDDGVGRKPACRGADRA